MASGALSHASSKDGYAGSSGGSEEGERERARFRCYASPSLEHKQYYTCYAWTRAPVMTASASEADKINHEIVRHHVANPSSLHMHVYLCLCVCVCVYVCLCVSVCVWVVLSMGASDVD
jgi:hypothetical protein